MGGKIFFTSLLLILSLKNDDDVQISILYKKSHKLMTEEFLDINDKCNQFGLSIKSVCHYAKIKFLEIVELSKINEKKFEFEVSLSEELVLVRVNALLSVSGNSFNSAFDEFVSLAGIKM